MSHFMFLSDIDGPRWALMGLVVKLAHSVSRDWLRHFSKAHMNRFSAGSVSLLWYHPTERSCSVLLFNMQTGTAADGG